MSLGNKRPRAFSTENRIWNENNDGPTNKSVVFSCSICGKQSLLVVQIIWDGEGHVLGSECGVLHRSHGWVQVLSSGWWEVWRVLSRKWSDVVCVTCGGPVAALSAAYGEREAEVGWGLFTWSTERWRWVGRDLGGVEGWVEEVEGADCGSRECGGAGERGVGVGGRGRALAEQVRDQDQNEESDNDPAGRDSGESEMQGRCPAGRLGRLKCGAQSVCPSWQKYLNKRERENRTLDTLRPHSLTYRSCFMSELLPVLWLEQECCVLEE